MTRIEETWRFSSRAILVCIKSDPAQPHFIKRKYGQPTSACIICNGENYGGYHIYCDTCDSYIHHDCFFKTRCRLSDLTNPHTLESCDKFESCFACGHPSWKQSFHYRPLNFHCNTCKKSFHRACHLYPPEINHPFHSLHPLTLTFSSDSSYPSHFIASKHLPPLFKREDPFDFKYPETDSKIDPETDPERDPETDRETNPKTDPETDSETDPETDPETDRETNPNTDPETDPEIYPKTDSETNHEIDLELDPERDPETGLETELETDPETDSETDPEAYPKTDPKPNPETTKDASISDAKCNCCPKKLQQVYYHCSLCNFNINLPCTRNPPPLTITNFKSHKHILTFFPRRIHSPCDACGLSLENTDDLVYACVPCNYIVHRTCIFIPRVIQITRHPHRLALSPSLPPGLFSCGVCRHPINVSYGQFSCQKGCHYAAHSKCAVGDTVWDGKDLEGVPEEAEEELSSFVRIHEETIQHFSHEHPLKLCEDNNVWGKNRFYEACTLPILVSESSYICMECNFILHEACASLPRKIGHPLHKHRLVLHPVPGPFEFEQVQLTYRGVETNTRHLKDMFKCNGCDQISCGFVYQCGEEGCTFRLDTRCASLPDPFIHGSHPHHDLFFNLTKGKCMGCNSSDCSPYYLECMECKSFLDLKCARLPSVTRYKHDKHPLTLCYGNQETSSGQYWCEICETKLDAKVWFYACNEYCNVTLHVSCLLGKMFLKPTSFLVDYDQYLFSILRNNDNTRAICLNCRRRCA